MTTPTHDPQQLKRAAELVVTTQFASVAMLMRRLRVGFGPAAYLMNLLEENGVVGPHKPFASRDVLVRAERLDEVLAQLGVEKGADQ